MERRTMLLAAASVAAGGCCACSRWRSASQTVVVATTPYLSTSGFHLAVEQGYFRQQGVEIEARQISNSAQTVPLLAGGQLDAATVALNPALVNAVAKGARLRIVAAHTVVSTSCGQACTLYGARRSFPAGLSSMGQLRGKRVAIQRRGGFSEFCLDAMLANAGMNQDDLQVSLLEQAEGIAAVAGGSLDVVVGQGLDIDLTAAAPDLTGGPTLASVLPGFQPSFVVFGRRLLEGDVSLGTRFLKAYLRGDLEFVRGRTPKFTREYARRYGLNVTKLANTCRDVFVEGGTIDLPSVQRFIDWAVRKRYCPQPVKADVLVDQRFLAHLAKEVAA